MSFTTEIKQEIASLELNKNCMKAQLSALIQCTASLTFSSNGLTLVSRSESPTTSKRVVALFKKLYKSKTELTINKKTNLKKNNVYTVEVYDDVKMILEDLGLYTESKGLLSHPTYDIVSNKNAMQAYIGGSFLAYGSCNDPKNSNYHLEISLSDIECANFVVKLLEKCGFLAKLTKRRNKYIVYFKKADVIADLLKMVGAYNSCLKFENIRIDRDFVNSKRRIENCYIANERKTLAAADAQLEYMFKIKEAKKENKLDPKLREVYDLRIKYQDASLNEICDKYEKIYGTSISKSGLKHRLNKIQVIAEKL